MQESTHSDRPTHQPISSRSAFSLLEILVAVSIAVILLGITIAATSNIRKAAMRTECASNLREIGNAIKVYAIDHNNRLPGPIYYTQLSKVKGGNHLAALLAPYLDYTLTGDENTEIDPFVCPAVRNEHPDSIASYYANHQVRTMNGPRDPWGDSKDNEAPLTLTEITAILEPSQEWALIDAYGKKPAYPKGLGMMGPPLHGKTNMLFFDGHVESR